MSDTSRTAKDARGRDELVQAGCHPAGRFIEFREEEIEQSIPERFEQQVRRYPDRVAVKTRQHELTYAMLNAAANRVARGIIERRGEGQEPVALLMEKGAPLIAAILGTLKAGKIYVVISPSLPPARMRQILEDAQPGLVVTNDRNAALARQVVPDESRLMNGETLDAGLSADDLRLPISPDAPALLVYTSGSTGKPKGVVLSHLSLMRRAWQYTNRFHLSAEDRLTLLGSSSTDILSALLNGAALYPMDVQEEGIASLAGWLIREEITVYHSVATLFRQFVGTLTGREAFPALRMIRLQGEPVQWSDAALCRKHFAPGCVFVNSYAVSETGPISFYFVDRDAPIAEGRVPVGPPVEDLDLLLLDEHGREVPPGDTGEIAIRSRYLASGYWRNPDLTRAKFHPDPKASGAQLYLTGDRGRLTPEGVLHHLGRNDFQVKVRGYRIEPGEVEAALLEMDAFEDAVVVARADAAGEDRLVAYAVPKSGVQAFRHSGVQGDPVAAHEYPITISALRRELALRLPDHMIPSAFVLLEALPRTVTGKVDRRALPAPSSARPALDTPFAPPRTPVEEILIRIWTEVLDLDQIGIHDRFLDLGGDSLKASQGIARALQAFGVQVPVPQFLETPTVAAMAVLITESLAEQAGSEEVSRVLQEG